MRLAPIEALGFRSIRYVATAGRMAVFLGQILRAVVTPPTRLRRLVGEVYDSGVLSLLIVCGSGVAVGAVLGLQGYSTLVRFGAENSLGSVVGLSLVRELGPVLTGLLVTGRGGSAMAAEIASMVATEQLDGLRMLSIDPVHLVVAPKALAMLFVMPLLAALFTTFGIFGGYVVGVHLLGVDGGTYLNGLESVDFPNDVAGSLVKSAVFGALVGLIATYRGYTSEPSSAGVSRATTSTVVIASVSILVVDYVITALWGV
ncbi:MAG TPA: MlaE family lipid ABC transporter permease subunit [Myxococcota bacterium]|nr:MlaE family lipid ABC transporter permease subunit [Myxococcota bacterium]